MPEKSLRKRVPRKLGYWLYKLVIMPLLVRRIRHKKVRSVVFLLSELGSWKTERLYRAMVEDPRFDPHIVVIDSPETPGSRRPLEDYLSAKGIDFVYIPKCSCLRKYYKPDIIFYQKPYRYAVPRHFRIRHNRLSLFCYVPYGFSSTVEPWSINHYVHQYAWKIFLDNESAAADLATLSSHGCGNFSVTGLPMSDDFLDPSLGKDDPWVNPDRSLKRIIWAPHHTIPSENNWLDYSTFLDYSEFMLEMARKYKGRAVFAFKPHPMLRHKLEEYWGKEKTDAYYARWAEGENTQIADGNYIGLFMNSDALIHDCASFTIEYQYTRKPALYLNNGHDHCSNLTDYARQAYRLHYMGNSESDIVGFIDNVLAGKDRKAQERDEFVERYLIPSGGSACRNILDELCR